MTSSDRKSKKNDRWRDSTDFVSELQSHTAQDQGRKHTRRTKPIFYSCTSKAPKRIKSYQGHTKSMVKSCWRPRDENFHLEGEGDSHCSQEECKTRKTEATVESFARRTYFFLPKPFLYIRM